MTTRIDLDELERIAKAATRGPWSVAEGTIIADLVPAPFNVKAAIADVTDPSHPTAKRDARFIAAADPTTVLALIARVRELEAGLVEACGIADASTCVGPTRSEQERIAELRAIVKGERYAHRTSTPSDA